MIGWKHVGEISWTESLALWSIRTAPFLHILHITHAHILNDWLETYVGEIRWTKLLV